MQSRRTVDVAAATGTIPLGRLPLLIAGLGGLIAMCDGLDNQSLAFTAPAIAAEWGIRMPAFAPVFSVGLFGLMLGSLGFGWAGDRFGRKRMLIASAALFSVMTLITPHVATIGQLMVVRFVGGLGIGGLPASLAALVSEWTPGHWRGRLTTWVFIGIPFGGMVGGFAASWLIPHLGWPSVYYAAGALSIALLLAGAAVIPESVHFLALRGAPPGRIAALLNRLDPSRVAAGRYDAQDRYVMPASDAGQTRVMDLFADGRAGMTILFWLAEIVELMIFYVLVNWIPTLLRQSGMPLQMAVLGSASLNLGAVLFTIALGPLCDRYGARQVTAATYVLTSLALMVMVLGGNAPSVLLAGAFFAGAGCLGGQAVLFVLITNSYPPGIRTTGAGWALTVGRIGSIVSPAVVGIPLGWGWDAHMILALPVIPSLLGGVCVWCARRSAPPELAPLPGAG